MHGVVIAIPSLEYGVDESVVQFIYLAVFFLIFVVIVLATPDADCFLPL
jgi:hypothetical protein